MKQLIQSIPYTVCQPEELDESDRRLIEQAKAACDTSYAPYSHFRVGAALRLEDGTTVCGSNQENAAYSSGTCAERCTLFYANAHHPGLAPDTIAIAARADGGDFTPAPITPCGACRQVLIEAQHRYGRPLRVLLYGSRHTYILGSISDLLPFQFDADAL